MVEDEEEEPEGQREKETQREREKEPENSCTYLLRANWRLTEIAATAVSFSPACRNAFAEC